MKICKVDGCNNRHVASGFCRTHYYRYRRYGNPLVVKQKQNRNGNGKCKVEGCTNKHQARGYCKKHLYRFDKYGDPLKIKTYPEGCSVKGCNNKHYGIGLCAKHYERFKKHGDPNVTLIRYHEPCKQRNCKNTARKYGYCEKHLKYSKIYQQRSRTYSAKRRMLKQNSLENDFDASMWLGVLKEFDNKCAYCGRSDNLEIEHIVPVSKCGSHTKHNIIPACKECNRSKRARYIEDWYPYQEFYDKEKEMKIYKWIGYKTDKPIQLKLF